MTLGRFAIVTVIAVTALRVVALAFNQTDLFVDEAQYWFWGQELAFGYYSKPPLIGWLIRLTTEIGGSDSIFWVRVSAPILHGITALLIGRLAALYYGRRTGHVAALGYVLLPMAAAGSVLISTDSILLPLLTLAVIHYTRLVRDHRPGAAIWAGLFLGLAFLAKYAAVYFLIGGALAALVARGLRPRGREALVLLLVFFVVVSPNLVWNATNGLATFQHTIDNAAWVRAPEERVRWSGFFLSRFFFSQFLFFGPVTFAALLLIFWRFVTGRLGQGERLLAALSLPVLVIISAQAFLARANENWAAATYVGGTVLAFGLLVQHRRWLAASFVLNGALCLLLLIAPLFALSLPRPGSKALLLEKYVGRHLVTDRIVDAARAEGLTRIVAADRDLLADLFYRAAPQGFEIAAVPPQGRARHHYELAHPLAPSLEGDVLAVVYRVDLPGCDLTAGPVAVIAPDFGEYRRKELPLYRLPARCIAP